MYSDQFDQVLDAGTVRKLMLSSRSKAKTLWLLGYLEPLPSVAEWGKCKKLEQCFSHKRVIASSLSHFGLNCKHYWTTSKESKTIIRNTSWKQLSSKPLNVFLPPEKIKSSIRNLILNSNRPSIKASYSNAQIKRVVC